MQRIDEEIATHENAVRGLRATRRKAASIIAAADRDHGKPGPKKRATAAPKGEGNGVAPERLDKTKRARLKAAMVAVGAAIDLVAEGRI